MKESVSAVVGRKGESPVVSREASDRICSRQSSAGVLELMAALSIENARLYRELAERDATIRCAADALSTLQMELARANRLAALGQLAISIAHEVSQPIGAACNSAHAALRFLARVPPDLAEVRAALECVVNDAHRAGDIIDRIRARFRKAPPRTQDVDLNAAIEEVIVFLRGELSKHRVSIRMQLAEGLMPVRADRVQLQQVMLNLILNAIQAMGSVASSARQLSICTEASAAEGLVVAVCDSGPGVAAADRERIFDSFYTTKAGGVGIGLSICRAIIHSHSGRLWVDSAPSGGAVFKFMLPARP
jgi:C4-dicarboxylate-specific signal transduction histidine kinase